MLVRNEIYDCQQVILSVMGMTRLRLKKAIIIVGYKPDTDWLETYIRTEYVRKIPIGHNLNGKK